MTTVTHGKTSARELRCDTQPDLADNDMMLENKHRRGAWFEECKFGLFIHWGLYSIHATTEWALFKEQIPVAEYDKLKDVFCPPANFSPEQWVLLAKRAGMKYAVLTTRHHDGFALWDSKLSDFNSVKSASRRDFVREFVDACRKHDLRVGLYYSIMNWQFPASISGPIQDPAGWEEMVANCHGQLRELMTHYGKIDLLWYDGCVTPGMGDPLVHQKYWRTPELNTMVRSLQPKILINCRSAMPEDFATPEQHVCAPPAGRRWEACMTINNSWGFNQNDHAFKKAEEIKACLIKCASFGGNLLLNIGPMADGSVQKEAVEVLEKIGDWLAINGEAFYGTHRTAFSEALRPAGAASSKNGVGYIFLPGGKTQALIAGLVPAGARVSLLGDPNRKIQVAPLAGKGDVLQITGLPEHEAVLRIDARPSRHQPSVLDDVGHFEFESESPVLKASTDRCEPEHAEIIGGTNLRKMLKQISPSEVEISLDVPVDGRYDVQIGVVLESPATMTAKLDGREIFSTAMHFGAHPDSVKIQNVALRGGTRTLTLASPIPFSIYAARIEPIWRPLPSENWAVVGPLATKFGPQAPLSCVKEALAHTFGPEENFEADAEFDGAHGQRVRWDFATERLGNHTDVGVNFAIRCGPGAPGVGIARTIIHSPIARDVMIVLGCDWWANVYLNGQMITTSRSISEVQIDGAWFNTWKPMPAKIHLRKGSNVLLVKCHMGSTMHWFTCRINDPGDLTIQNAEPIVPHSPVANLLSR